MHATTEPDYAGAILGKLSLPYTSLALALTLAIGCRYTPPTPQAYVTHGVALRAPITTLVALPVVCEGFSIRCEPAEQVAVAAAARLGVEYLGYSLVDSDLLNAELRVRRTTEVGGSGPVEEVSGKTWFDLDTEARRAFVAQIGAHGVLHTAINSSGYRDPVTVRLAVTRLEDDALVWQSQCTVATSDYHDKLRAMDLATQCALESMTLW